MYTKYLIYQVLSFRKTSYFKHSVLPLRPGEKSRGSRRRGGGGCPGGGHRGPDAARSRPVPLPLAARVGPAAQAEGHSVYPHPSVGISHVT